MPQYAVVTPYYRETRECLERCIRSVKNQTVHADHILVADGFPQDWIDEVRVRHLRMERNYADYGNTPRARGAIIAAEEGYDGIGFLDADCWYEPDHLEHCLETWKFGFGRCAFVAARRTLRRLDGSVIHAPDESGFTHIDTSCFFFLPPSYDALSTWALMPREVSPVCDRVVSLVLRAKRLKPAFCRKKTVNFTYTYAPLYRSLGEPPPQPVKENPDHRAILNWIDGLDSNQLEMINRRLGANLRALYRPNFDPAVPGAMRLNTVAHASPTFDVLIDFDQGV